MKNRLLYSALSCSPYEKLTSEKPKLKFIRIFGCSTFVYNENLKSKFHATPRPGIMLGFDDNGVYTVELFPSRKPVNTVHVIFDETTFPALEKTDSSASSSEDELQDSQPDNSSDTDSSSDSSSDSDVFPATFGNGNDHSNIEGIHGD